MVHVLCYIHSSFEPSLGGVGEVVETQLFPFLCMLQSTISAGSDSWIPLLVVCLHHLECRLKFLYVHCSPSVRCSGISFPGKLAPGSHSMLQCHYLLHLHPTHTDTDTCTSNSFSAHYLSQSLPLTPPCSQQLPW